VIVPFWLVVAMCGFRRTREVWPACLTAGLSFAIVQFLVSNFHGPWLVDIVASLVSIVSMVVLLRFWQPKEIWRFDDDPPVEEELTARRRPGPATGELSPGPGAAARSELPVTSDRREAFMAWLPWILLAVLVFLWGTPRSSRS
jgi:lactate permease